MHMCQMYDMIHAGYLLTIDTQFGDELPYFAVSGVDIILKSRSLCNSDVSKGVVTDPSAFRYRNGTRELTKLDD